MENRFLEGRTAIVTGGTRGIGFAIAQALAVGGASVAICGRTQAALDEAVGRLINTSGSKVIGRNADVRSSTEVAALFALVDSEFGGPDVVVNNAGIGIFRSVAELTEEEWQNTLQTNLSGVFHCTKEAVARMRKRGGGYILNVGSLAGVNAFAGGAAYNASKFGLYGFSEALMLDHRYDNIRVTHIMPGSVDTEFSSRSGQSDWKIAPEDIAEIVLMLLRMPERTLVSRVDVRPSKPRK